MRPGAVALACACAVACARAPAGQEGFTSLAAGDAAGAEASFRAALRGAPNDPRLKDGLGAALAAQQRWQDGCPLLGVSSAPLTGPDCWDRAFAEAQRLQRWAQIVVYARHVDVGAWPRERAENFLRVATHAARQTEDWNALARLYPQLIGLHPEDAQLHYLYGRVLETRQVYDGAAREYDLASSLDPQNEEIRRASLRLAARVKRDQKSGARVENMAAAATQPAERGTALTIESWSGGAISARIAISDEAAPGATTDAAAVGLSFEKAYWPAGSDADLLTARLAGRIQAIKCRRPPLIGSVALTIGPDGTVANMAVNNLPPATETCLRRDVKSWVLDDLRGGYLKFSFKFPPPVAAAH